MKHLKHHLQHINSKFIFEGDTPNAERIEAARTAIKAHEGATELEENDVQRLAETCVAKLPATADISSLLTQALADDPDKLISSAEIDALCDELVTLVDGGAAATPQLPEAPEGHRYVTTEDITPFLTNIPELYHEQVTQKLLTTTVPIESTGDAFEELMRRNVFEATGELTLKEEDAPDGHRWLTLSEISDWLETIEAADHDKAFQMVSKDPLNNDLEGEALAAEIARRQTAAETQIAIDNAGDDVRQRAGAAAGEGQDPETVIAAAAVAGLDGNSSPEAYQAIANATSEYKSEPGTLWRVIENLIKKLEALGIDLTPDDATRGVQAGVGAEGASRNGRYIDGSQFNGNVAELEGEGDHARLDHASAAGMLSSRFQLKNGVSAQGMRTVAVRGMHALDDWLRSTGYGGPQGVITSITDGQHASGTYSHAEGYKVDIRSREAYGEALAQATGLTGQSGTFILNLDGIEAKIYRHGSGSNNHFDIAFTPA